MKTVLKSKNKKGSVGNLIPWVTVLFFVAMLLGVTLYVLAKFQSQIGQDLGNSSEAYQAVGETITALGNIPSWFTILIIALMAGIVIAAVAVIFAFGRRRTAPTA